MKPNNVMLNISKKLLLTIFAVMFILSSISAYANPDAENKISITLVKQVEVTSEDIILEDLVLIQGNLPEITEKLKSVFIGKAPLPGQSRRIDRNYVVLRLKQNDINLDQITFLGPIETEVVRGYIQITKEEIEKIITTELPAILGLDEDKTTIKDIQAAGGIILPKGKYTYSIEPPKNSNYLGKLLLSVYFTVQDGQKKRVYVSATIEQYADVVVVRWPLRRNHLIKDVDVELKKMNLGDLPSNCIMDIKDVLGNKTKISINKDAVLRTDMIDMPPMIEKKDIVLMVAESESFKIVTLGESKEKGNKGDLIKVVNLDSKNEVYGRVIDSNSVKVEF